MVGSKTTTSSTPAGGRKGKARAASVCHMGLSVVAALFKALPPLVERTEALADKWPRQQPEGLLNWAGDLRDSLHEVRGELETLHVSSPVLALAEDLLQRMADMQRYMDKSMKKRFQIHKARLKIQGKADGMRALLATMLSRLSLLHDVELAKTVGTPVRGGGERRAVASPAAGERARPDVSVAVETEPAGWAEDEGDEVSAMPEDHVAAPKRVRTEAVGGDGEAVAGEEEEEEDGAHTSLLDHSAAGRLIVTLLGEEMDEAVEDGETRAAMATALVPPVHGEPPSKRSAVLERVRDAAADDKTGALAARANLVLGVVYERGIGVIADRQLAVKHYLQAGERGGRADALAAAGRMLAEDGDDVTRAVTLLQAGERGGSLDASLSLAVLLMDDRTGAVAAQLGDGETDVLAEDYLRKIIESPPSASGDETVSADGGVVAAAHNLLGKLHYDGKASACHGKSRPDLALGHFLTASAMGLAQASNNAGKLYESGEGTAASAPLARRHYRLAIRQSGGDGGVATSAPVGLGYLLLLRGRIDEAHDVLSTAVRAAEALPRETQPDWLGEAHFHLASVHVLPASSLHSPALAQRHFYLAGLHGNVDGILAAADAAFISGSKHDALVLYAHAAAFHGDSSAGNNCGLLCEEAGLLADARRWWSAVAASPLAHIDARSRQAVEDAADNLVLLNHQIE